jgi:alkanesulfonate monooxygenase SsuD/methylene tetrahydromethanopterin reductase-like flavin-dependent oxidoreductase (luciferase family)
VSVPPFTDARTVVGWACDAEAAGWDGLFLWDHVQWGAGAAPLDPWVLLGAMAQATARVRMGTLVTPLSRRRPYVVAKHLVTLDHLSEGRAVLGVGLGEPVDLDFADLGEEADPRVRGAMLDEALQVVDSLLRGPTDHVGTHYRVRAELRPRPVQRPRPPVWVAGVAPHRKPLERAARWDGVVPIGRASYLSPEELAAYLHGAAPRDGWDVVACRREGVPAQEYADVGTTWLLHAPFPTEGWEASLTEAIHRGPRP